YDFPLFNAVRNAFGVGASMQQLVDPASAGQALPRYHRAMPAPSHPDLAEAASDLAPAALPPDALPLDGDSILALPLFIR
ncbi:MAG: hypothetical protein DI592_05240, partial [Stenotrophomonas maltophilia]